ncbi:uncharacterized protein N7477_004913 [Penicillium maclennaniae]|uniref:uncharacterized protein n=1 Tax=Penicillium maclennaniae TaxID=1343394 RepID=UPI002541DFEC|nr:uncharacterized protein N7477_004913 [Penicillium maclennaniae]KAJ5674979.1 hypothetical protein N7477_004913 [Penicillium maclennaniae]
MPTTLLAWAELNHLFTVDQAAAATKAGYIIKPIRKGRSEGIMFGEDQTTADSHELISTIARGGRYSKLPEYVVQPLIHQLLSQHLQMFGQHCRGHVVEICHIAHGVLIGLRVWHAGSARVFKYPSSQRLSNGSG